jgi:hypothetical protein
MKQSLTFSLDIGKCGKLNSPGPWGMPIDDFLWINISYILCPKTRLHAGGADLNFSSKVWYIYRKHIQSGKYQFIKILPLNKKLEQLPTKTV